ncbi:MAG: dipicolinic acid synthetase subunit A [Firmicutes bacterium HGW-Firmicutes-8]|nr:MAG: dipicolinic acid synthetase subunit A [Firmicutes bacterium HGW-Firmicutes-8]
MSSVLTGVIIAVLGGDDRQLVLIPELVRLGADIKVAGISKLAGDKDVQCFYQVEEAVRDARFVILPMAGIDEKGFIGCVYGVQPLLLDNEKMLSLRDDCVIITGVARPLLKELVAQRRLKLVELNKIDELAVLNSIPSAEGAIQMAMEATDCTIHGSNSIVLGLGRCGLTLARMLAGMGAKVSVAARKPKDLARIREMGMEPLTFEQLPGYVGKADIVFNTVPQLVLGRKLLEQANPGVYICDIASAPGGVDFEAAGELGIKADLAPSLPGRVAPRTAGLILAKVIPDIITGELAAASSLSLVWDSR